MNTKHSIELPATNAPVAVEQWSKRDVFPRERLVSNIEERVAVVERIMKRLGKCLN